MAITVSDVFFFKWLFFVLFISRYFKALFGLWFSRWCLLCLWQAFTYVHSFVGWCRLRLASTQCALSLGDLCRLLSLTLFNILLYQVPVSSQRIQCCLLWHRDEFLAWLIKVLIHASCKSRLVILRWENDLGRRWILAKLRECSRFARCWLYFVGFLP